MCTVYQFSSGFQTEDEREMCARTIYCTNIDKKVNISGMFIDKSGPDCRL